MSSWQLFLAGCVLSFILRFLLIINGSDVADIHSLNEMGQMLLQPTNPYLALNYNVYPPLAIYLEAGTILLSKALNLPFFIISKVWPNFADFTIAILIYNYLKNKTSSKQASFWSLIYLLNPVSIIISSSHGQIDSLVSLGVLTSILLLEKVTLYKIILSGLSLGLVITLKPNPLILAPFFLIFVQKRKGFYQTLLFLGLIFAPVILLLWPFVKDYPPVVIGKILGYSGSNDFGFPALYRAVEYFRHGSKEIYLSKEFIQFSKWLFLACWVGLILLYSKKNQLVKISLAANLLFISIYFGISAQYLIWVLPLAILIKDKMIFLYSIAATTALLGYYLYFNPRILAVQFGQISIYQPGAIFLYTIGNLFLLIIIFLWLIKILIKPLTGSN